MNLSEARELGAILSLPKFPSESFRIRWHSGFWDGPTSGIVSVKDRDFWFEMVEENPVVESGKWYRRFAVVELSDEQLKYEIEVHSAFQEHVGTHCDHDGPFSPDKVRPSESHHLFYDKYGDYCKGRPFEACHVIGWFEQ